MSLMSSPSWQDGFKNMLELINSLPEQFEYTKASDIVWPHVKSQDIKHIIVCGMGGSAIGGDILRCCLMPLAPVPVLVNRGYELPSFAGKNTLVFAVSYSGNTEETLNSFEEALARGAQIVAVTSGGVLAKRAGEEGVPVIRVPGGLPPRASLGYLFAPLALAAEGLGVAPGMGAALQETIDVLKRMRDELAQPGSEASKLAARLKGKITVIWGSGPLVEAAAMRWKAQFNENAKSMAFYNCFPELNHNEFVGFEAPQDLMDRVAVLILQDHKEHGQNIKRTAITKELLHSRVPEFEVVNSRGDSIMARLLSLIYFGDYVSVYLAREYETDPMPVTLIEELKQRLKESGR